MFLSDFSERFLDTCSHQRECVMCKFSGIFPITLQYVRLYTHDLLTCPEFQSKHTDGLSTVTGIREQR